jgi:tetratricopeptide (TPR) repeat protein
LQSIRRAAGFRRPQPSPAGVEAAPRAAEAAITRAPASIGPHAATVAQADRTTAELATPAPQTSNQPLDPVDWCTSLADLEKYLQAAQAQAPDEAWPLKTALVWAFENRHWDKAITLATGLTERFPNMREGYEFGARALRRTGRGAEADALLAAAAQRFADAVWPLTQAAGAAVATKAWQRAAELAAIIRARFPNDLAGHQIGVQSLRHLRQFAAAEALLEPALAIFPDDEMLLVEAAWLAQQGANWAAGTARTKILRTRFPHRQIGFRIGATCEIGGKRYANAGEILATALQAFGAQDWILAEQARLAARAGDLRAADDKWAQLRVAFAASPDGYIAGAATKRELGDHASAEALLQEAVTRFPQNKDAHQAFAQMAEARQDWGAAEGRWTAARAAIPADAAISLSWATLPFRASSKAREHWTEGFVRLRGYHFLFPDAVAGYTAHVQFLCRVRRFDEARAICADALKRFGNDAALALAYGQLLEDTQCLDEAAEHYQRFLQHQPQNYVALIRRAAVLSKRGHDAAADDTCTQAIVAYPLRPEAYRTFAHMAMRRRDWRTAETRWLDAAQRFPSDPVVPEFLHYTRFAMLGDSTLQDTTPSIGHADAAPQAGNLDAVPASAQASLAVQFESLGGNGAGCEFGMVQRAMGAEPLGLLRWARTDLPELIAALDCQFEGVGTPEQTVLAYYLRDAAGVEFDDPEYATTDSRFGMRTHTFIRRSQLSEAEMHAQSCRRLKFLKRKLIEDLQAGAKIFVFKIADRNLAEQEIDALHAALCRYGRNTLLYVRYETPDHPSGTATMIRDGVIIGYIDHFVLTQSGEGPPNVAAWISICQQAWRLHRMSNPELIGAAA